MKAKLLLPGENAGTVLIAAFIGLLAGVANIIFRDTEEFIHHQLFERGYELLHIGAGGWRLILLPLLPIAGVLLLIPLSLLFPGEVNGYGFTRFLRKVNLEGGRIKARTILPKILSTTLTISTGNSAGVEGPIAQLGGALGSLVGQFFRVSGSRMKVFIAAGCAGGVGAIFNAPVAGIFFASEIVLLGTYEMTSFVALVISSSIATVVSRAYYGESPAFPIAPYHLVNPLVEIPLYTLMGILIGLIAVFHIRFFYYMRDRWSGLDLHPQLKPVAGAAIVGTVAIFFPQIMGNGYSYIAETLAGQGVFWVMLALILLKIVATAVTLGSGGAGGVFAPALFIGAVIGGCFGTAVHGLFPDMTASPGAYATVGIGAFLAASTHAPLTAIFLLFEMTGNYMIIIPIMVTSVIGTVVASKVYPDSIDTVDFSREGIDIHEGRETAIMKSIKVGSVMTEDVDFVSEKANANQLMDIFSQTRDSFYFPVIDESGRMTGIVSLQDVKSVLHDRELGKAETVGSVCARKVISLTPDDNLHTAMLLFDLKGIEEIPVIESMEDKWVIGMLKRRDAISAYNREAIKRGISERASSIHFTPEQK